jgi:hypothetical protein
MFLGLVVFFGHMLKSESTFETFDIKMDDSQLNFKEISVAVSFGQITLYQNLLII